MPAWAGDKVGSNGMHKRVRRARGDACEYGCVDCGERAEDWSQIHDSNRLDVNNYEPRCTKCHIGSYDKDSYINVRTPEANPILRKGFVKTPEHRQNIATAMTGRVPSAETRAKMSAAQTARWARERKS